jgi:hypothetical protein
MFRSSFGALLLLGVVSSVAACGAKAKGGGTIPAGAVTEPGDGATPPPGTYQPPTTTYEQPPTTYGRPPTTYDSPGGSGSAFCTRLCNLAATQCAAQAPSPEEIAACPGSCEESLTELEPCGDELVAALDCWMGTPLFGDLLAQACAGQEPNLSDDEVEASLLAACRPELEAYAACLQGAEPGGRCTVESSCTGCATTCDSCLCFLDGDTESCASSCDN